MTTAHEHEIVAPVPVHVVGDETTKNESPPFGSWSSYKFVGTERPVQVLPQTEKRKRAVIWCLPGYVNNNTTGAVMIGTRAQCEAASPSDTAGIMVSGQTVEVTNQQAVYMVPDGSHSLTVTVLDERY